MIRMRFRIPSVGTEPILLPKSPCCGSGLVRHQRCLRGLTDIRHSEVHVQRYRCKKCHRTFTVRPPGVSRSSKSCAVRALAVLLYCLGLSYDAVTAVLEALGAPIAKGTAYNYVRAAGKGAHLLHRKGRSGRIWAAGQDTTVFKVRGKKAIVSFVTDALSAQTVDIAFVDNEDAQTLLGCLQRVAGEDLKLLVSDDAGPYEKVAQALGAEHQVCLAHAKKSMIRRCARILKELPRQKSHSPQIVKDLKWLQRAFAGGKKLTARFWTWSKERLTHYISARPPPKGQKASAAYRMRLLLTDVVENGLNVFTYRRYKDKDGRLLLDGTNNVTERAIGWNGKIRYRLMRGAKSKGSLRDFLYLNALLRNHRIQGHNTFDWGILIA